SSAADIDPRRGDFGARSGERGDRPSQPRAHCRGPHRDHGVAPSVFPRQCRCYCRARPRPHRRLRQTQRAVIPLCHLPSPVEPAPPAPRPMTPLPPAAIDFQSDARKIDERRPPWVARATLYALVAVIVVAGIWAAVAKVDRIVVAQGKLVTTASTIVVQPLETSTVRSLHARVGDIVRKGDVLAT